MNVISQVSKLENSLKLQEGSEERFNGYGVMGLTFKSGHVLAYRNFMATSIGPGFQSVWHRRPDGEWTFYTDINPSLSCPRYFGEQARQAITETIDVTWIGHDRFRVEINRIGLKWEVILSSTVGTKLMNLAAGVMPDKWWKNETILRLMSRVAGNVLETGRIALSGYAPNGQYFIANPYKLWIVSDSHALLGNMDFGEMGPLAKQAHLRDFWIPQKGIFAFGRAYFEPFNKEKHSNNAQLPFYH
jgi:hypothetical protein